MNKPFNPETLEGQYYNALYALIEKKSPKIASSLSAIYISPLLSFIIH